MKIEDLKKLGVKDKALSEIEVNPLEIISSDEFYSPNEQTRKGDTYRDRAVKRALKAKINFHGESNCTLELVKNLGMNVVCPYCGKTLPAGGGGGNCDVTVITFECEPCGVKVGLRIDLCGGIYVQHEKKRGG